eukprot:scaffold13549_cov148-Skeletonema_marinoi.AAC.3
MLELRPPTVRRCSDADTTKKILRRDEDASILSWPTIKLLIDIYTAEMGNGAKVLQAAVPNWASSGHLPYDVVAMPIRPKRACAVMEMPLNYHGQLEWALRSC